MRSGPILLLLPLAFLALGVVLLAKRSGSPRTESVEVDAHRPETLAGFTGSARHAGGELTVTITPLHELPSRQRFDAEVLRARFGLDEGEPWRVVLELSCDATDELALDGASVVAGAARLVPLPRSPSAGGAPDPLGVLLGTAPAGVAPCGRAQLFLFGPRPAEGAGARLELADGTAVALAPGSVRRAALPQELARVETRPASPDDPGDEESGDR